MKSQARVSIAFIAANLISENELTSIFDYSKFQYIDIKVVVTTDKIDLYNFSQGCHVAGNGSDGHYSIFNFGDRHYIDFNIDEDKFVGYDYGTACSFIGILEDGSISFYDFEAGLGFKYGIELKIAFSNDIAKGE